MTTPFADPPARVGFHDRYAVAREAFLQLARERGAELRSHVAEGLVGADGEALAMDVATFGDPSARKAMLVVCGTHGLEGPPGSAAQRTFLASLKRLPRGVKVVAVHALNPWGFSHAARTDEANVDPNRNFLDFSADVPESPAYAELHPFQCPATWTDDAGARLREAAAALARAKGPAYVRAGMTLGQYGEPAGLNYGGAAPSWCNRTMRGVVAETLGACDRIAYVEWHSGFGGYGELFHVCLHPEGSPELDRAAAWWGREAVTRNGSAIEGGDGSTPAWRGLLLAELPRMIPQAEVVGAVIEFGTFENARVLGGLMIDRWLRFGERNESSLDRAGLERAKREIFSPADPAWRAAVVERAVDAQHRALDGLVAW